MKPEDQRIAIAEACGWKRTPYQSASLQVRGDVPFWTDGKSYRQSEHFPDYLHDLNAIHDAEKTLRDNQIKMYAANLWQAMRLSPEAAIGTIHATASHRAQAFLHTIGKWTE